MSCQAQPLNWTSFRVRSDASSGLNASTGWAAEEGAAARIAYDAPFRIRVEVESSGQNTSIHELRLQYRKDEGSWATIGLSDFPYPKYATPEVSLLSTAPYDYGDETEDLLSKARYGHEEGIGLKGVQATPTFHLDNESIEWEWPLVIRRFYDGPGFNESETEFELRLIDVGNKPVPGIEPIRLSVFAPDGHLGGTFIETPSRIGPYQTSSGRLYFLMEPTETDNRFMVVASDDFGASWREVDGPGRPSVGDLEGVGSVFHDGIIHIVHQISEAVYYHAFSTEDSTHNKDKWIVDSELISKHSKPPTQSASLSIRTDGSLIAVYGDADGGQVKIRNANGSWRARSLSLETEGVTGLSGFEIATSPEGLSLIAYTSVDGAGWLRLLGADDKLSAPIHLTDDLGISDEENGAILPIITIPGGDAVFIFRRNDGILWERRWSAKAGLGPAKRMVSTPVVSGAVDSDQVGADAIVFGSTMHLLFIDQESRSLNYSKSHRKGEWMLPTRILGEIDAAWVRGNVMKNREGTPIYGFIYDAGSKGGAGMNRFGSLPLEAIPAE